MSAHEEKKQRLLCLICNKRYSDMPKHIKLKHKEIKSFKCNICESETSRKVYLQRHMKPFKCNICQYKSETKPDLDKHVESVHDGIKPLKCNICNYETGLNKYLKRHVDIVHKGLKPYKCNICEYETSRNDFLGRHIKNVHEGIKPFKCNNCDYETAQKPNLKTHIESVHERIKPFKCNKCDFDTSKKGNLRRHVETIHEEIKTFNCTLCDYEFSKQIYLKTHIESVHEGIKPFECHICQYKTAAKYFLKRHIALVHKNKNSENKNSENKNSENKNNENKKDFMIANMSESVKEIFEASLVISNAVVVNKEKGTKYCDVNNQEVIFQSIKVEPPTIKQSQTSDTADPLLIDKIKEEICEENEAMPIQDLSEVSIKQGEFGASEYQNEQESEMADLEIKEEFINPFVEYDKTMEPKMNIEIKSNERKSRKQSLNLDSLRKDFP